MGPEKVVRENRRGGPKKERIKLGNLKSIIIETKI